MLVKTERRGLTRRTVLRGLGGVAVGLPFLETFAPRTAKAHGGLGLHRFVAFFECNGIDTDRFWPDQGAGVIEGGALAGTALEALGPLSHKLLIPRGCYNAPGINDGTAGDGHQQGVAHRLTAAPIGGNGFCTGVSIDQVIAQHHNPEGRPALTLHAGHLGDGVSSYISYLGDEQPSPAENNPWLAYQDLVGLSGLDELQIEQLVTRRQSVLDLVEDEFDSLMGASQLSQVDRDKLDMHLTAIRDLETDLMDGLIACELDPDSLEWLESLDPGQIHLDALFPDTSRLHGRLIAMAMACGATSAATLMLGNGAAGPIYTFDGMEHEYNHHKLSHGNTQDDDSGAEVEGYRDMVHDIDRWHADRFFELIQTLDQYQEGDGTVLDNSVVVWCNELSDGFTHSESDLPFVIAGSGGGYLRQGEYLEVSQSGEPHNRLLTTLLNACGVTDEQGGPMQMFGDPAFGEAGEIDSLKA